MKLPPCKSIVFSSSRFNSIIVLIQFDADSMQFNSSVETAKLVNYETIVIHLYSRST